MIILLLILSIAPVVFFGYLIYKKDFDKEPTSILAKLFVCGVLSTLVTMLLTGVLVSVVPFFGKDTGKLSVIELIPAIFIGVALIEEFSKWIFVYILEYNDREFNHLYDGIVYAAFVSLGFACFENILYVMQGGVETALMRAFLAIPGHLCDGIMMGYYLSMAKLAKSNGNSQLSAKNLILSLLVPVLAHGIYDYTLFAASNTGNRLFTVAFYAFVIFFFTYASNKVKKLSINYYNLNPGYVPISVLISNNTVGYDANIVQQQRQMVGYQQSMPYQNGVYPQQAMVYQNGGYAQQQPMMNQNGGYVQQSQPMMYQNGGYAQQSQPMMNQNEGYAQQSQPTMSYPQQSGPAVKTCPTCGKAVNGRFCGDCGKEV